MTETSLQRAMGSLRPMRKPFPCHFRAMAVPLALTSMAENPSSGRLHITQCVLPRDLTYLSLMTNGSSRNIPNESIGGLEGEYERRTCINALSDSHNVAVVQFVPISRSIHLDSVGRCVRGENIDICLVLLLGSSWNSGSSQQRERNNLPCFYGVLKGGGHWILFWVRKWSSIMHWPNVRAEEI